MTDRFERPGTSEDSAISDLRDEIKDLRKRCHDLSNGLGAVNSERLAFEADLIGRQGDNGKIGNLKGAIATLRSVLVAVAFAALGGLGTGIVAVYQAGEERGGERARLSALEAQVAENAGSLKALVIWSEVMRLRLGTGTGGTSP